MNPNFKSQYNSSQASKFSTGYYQSQIQIADIEEYFLQEIKFGFIKKESIDAKLFARHLHNRIQLTSGDRNVYALEFFICGYRCFNASFNSKEQIIVSGSDILIVICFSGSLLMHHPVFDSSLKLLGVIHNKTSYSDIMVLQESRFFD